MIFNIPRDTSCEVRQLELETVWVANIEHIGYFSPPTMGLGVCVKSKGGKYSAEIMDATLAEVHVCKYMLVSIAIFLLREKTT